MAKPLIHAKSAAKRFGGVDTDYISIENEMDSSKAHFPSQQHRAIFHSSFGIFIIERLYGIDFTELKRLQDKHGWSNEEVEDILKFKEHCRERGTAIKNSNGKEVSVRDIAETHIIEDFSGRFIPTLADYLNELPIADWMNNGRGQPPPSFRKIDERKKITRIPLNG